MEISFDFITVTGGEVIPDEPPPVKTFMRGDINGDETVDIMDAVYGAQYLAGLRPLEDISPLNMASVHHDGADGDIMDMLDCIYIAQYVIGIRDSFYEQVP